MNEIAFDAVNNGAGRMPAGSFVIKENFNPARELAALTVMYKSPGFDAANNDWFYLMQMPDGTAAAEGRVEMCISCHVKERENDFLYTSRLSRPEPRAAAVWPFVMAEDYQKKWKLFPGTTAQQRGNSPHGAFVTTYVNNVALEGINGKRGTLAPGAMVLKENYMPDRTLAAVTLMYKVAGFDPDNGDWYWLQRTAGGMVMAEGKVAGCIGCHSAKAANDFLYLGPVR
jgi:cytochrome c553